MKVLDQKASDNEYLHKDFHGALCYAIKYLEENYGESAIDDYLRQVAKTYYAPLSGQLKQEGLSALERHWQNIFTLEGGKFSLGYEDGVLVLKVEECPAIAHIKKMVNCLLKNTAGQQLWLMRRSALKRDMPAAVTMSPGPADACKSSGKQPIRAGSNKMISCTEFIPAYSEYFKFLDKRDGREAVVRFWEELSDNFLDNLRDFVTRKGIAGCFEYWSHILTEEAADFKMTLDEEEGEFIIDMRYCPSMGRLLETEHIQPYEHYCLHCDTLYRRALEPLGFDYNKDCSGPAECKTTVRKKHKE